MLTTRHPVDFAYTRQELDALFRDANAHDVEKGGHSDARSAAMNVGSHHRANGAAREASEILGSFSFQWEPPALQEIETDEGFSLANLMRALGRLGLQALGYPKQGDVAV